MTEPTPGSRYDAIMLISCDLICTYKRCLQTVTLQKEDLIRVLAPSPGEGIAGVTWKNPRSKDPKEHKHRGVLPVLVDGKPVWKPV